MSTVDLKKMSDEELDEALKEKYGENWNIEDVDENDALVEEFFCRIKLGAD